MPKCSFCGKEYDLHKGLTFVKTDGVIFHFCSSKCRKNYGLGRDKKRVKWIRKKKISEKAEIEEIKREAEEKEEGKIKKEGGENLEKEAEIEGK